MGGNYSRNYSRNYIPAGEPNLAAKRPLGRETPNFIPGPDFVEKPRMTEDEQFEEATAARHRSRLRAQETAWAEACTRLNKATASHAVEILRALPSGMRDLYLLAEESNQSRSAVLGLFPAAGPTARETWKDYAESRTEEPVSTNEEEETK